MEKLIGLKTSDFTEIIPSMRAAFDRSRVEYLDTTHPKLRMLDNLIILSLATFVIQVVYGITFNRDPFNTFIAGVFSSLGLFGLSVSLRIQLSDSTFDDKPRSKLIFEYIVGCLCLFFSAMLLMDDR